MKKKLRSFLFSIPVVLIALLLGCDLLPGPNDGEEENRPPTADAGINQSVFTGAQVQLDGSGSSDPDGDNLSYSWSFTSIPGGSTAALSDPTLVNPTFTPDVDGDYVIQLVVNDGTVDSSPASITITASSDPSALPLEVVAVRSTGGYTVEVEFNKQVDSTSATNINSYEITFRVHELFITAASIDGTGKIVTLTTSNSQNSRDDSMLTLIVSNVEDTYGNIISDTNNQGTFRGTIPIGSAHLGSTDEYSVSGYIENYSGNRLSNFYISVSNPGLDNTWGDNWGTNDDIYLELYTDDNGFYSIYGLPSGSGDEITEPYFSMVFNFNDDVGNQIYEGKDFEGFNVEQITQNYTKNLVFYEVVSGTKVDGYIMDADNNPIPDFGGYIYLFRDDMQIIGIHGVRNGYSDPTEKCYYDSTTGYFHFQDCLAGGTYTLQMHDYDDNMYSSYTSSAFTATPGITTTFPTIVTYQITQNNKLPITMLSPADGATPDSAITFSWEDTDHSDIQSYTLGIWSEGNVDTSGDYPMPQGQPDMLYYIVPETVNQVTIDTSTSPMTISGDLYRQITNVQLSADTTYYWGVFAFNAEYNEADENGSFSGEPVAGLRSFSQTGP